MTCRGATCSRVTLIYLWAYFQAVRSVHSGCLIEELLVQQIT